MNQQSLPVVSSVLGELGQQLHHYAHLMRLHKPIGIWLLLWPTLWALWVAGNGSPDSWVFTVFVLGVIIMRSAGCVINDYADRNFDGRVSRTRDRPIVAGNVTPTEALLLFAALSMMAIGLVLTLDTYTQMLALVAALLTVVYPFCKRFFVAPQLVLGTAYGWSIPMAFAAQTGTVPKLAWLMWIGVVVWAMVYDTMYAMVDREDDRKLGIMSTAILFGQADVFIVSLLQFIFLVSLFLSGEVAGLGMWYRLSLLIVALLMLYQFALIRKREPIKCFYAFLNNHYIGITVFAGILLSYTFD
ncbi:MAG: 4-hydroxybenzoate octaprenyltransferase [Chromatiales bacterium]|jgi:4-hydroxybenzoate polyprenyltransferase|nr:4-hydroxybenzoate octaprenyltransferase [Chromatiales bacterium]MDP6149813.1 4-hydroxybenzoate octaprenyltransferase [Gammaproteobacteria bacterium]MDP7093362.1 4-hydroxybenzoate octaprenyltransferase [Gammaproteobacteria bacterium]MDP7271038.1 4-hydroxybenzoate octaprenyltransferase [Gammaproteobacteria bacterium]HJP04176.1 4-hydroxybenzoate octaprenyltransferase [Gammaproteobacteria bacterium]